MIRDLLDDKSKVTLFTRPRRFGKTLNMDMLRVFFEKTEADTSKYFVDKDIWKYGTEYKSIQGSYPVIFLSFKDVKYKSWEDTRECICMLITMECQRHSELEGSTKLSEYERNQVVRLATGTASNLEYQMSLQILSKLLHKHYGTKAIIMIDEYDTPVQQGYSYGFYTEIIDFMRIFFSGGLKDNPHLEYGFLTGILRVAKESIFSGLNNLKSYSILEAPYSQYFGFTKEEVKQLLSYYGVSEKMDEISQWYDGYMFGNTEIYNPWSVINYVSEGCMAKAFWQSTASNDMIGEIIAGATPEITKNLSELLSGKTIITYVDTSVIYPEIQKNPYIIYSFLLVTGYLKVCAIHPQLDGNYMCEVAIPNREIAFVYKKEVLERTNQMGMAVSIQHAIFTKNIEKLQVLLQEFMINSISFMDTGNESFYHGMMLGLCSVLSIQYQVKSNRESGLGRFDLMLIPREASIPGFIFEIKFAKEDRMDLDTLAEEALRQIDEKKYEAELMDRGVNQIIKIGIAFRGKEVSIKDRRKLCKY